MDQRGRERVVEYFGSKKAVMTTGALCLIYVLSHFFPETKYIAKLLPPLPLWYYGILGAMVLFYQGCVIFLSR